MVVYTSAPTTSKIIYVNMCIRGQYIDHTLHVYKYILVSLTWPSRRLSLYEWPHPNAREAQSTKDILIQLITLIINCLLR